MKPAAAGVVCCILFLAGCVNLNGKSYLEEECENGICTSDREYTAVCVENAAGYSECSDSGNINYTRGPADFRQYGERSPRDHRITQAGAGNNISAAIPPSIDNEVTEYEAGTAEPASAQWNPAAPVSGAAAAGQSAGVPGGGQAYNGYNGTPNAGTAAQNGGTQTGAEEDSDVKDWLAEEGQSLKELLTAWSDEAGWRLIWKTNRNYTLNAGAMFRGNFADVASALIRAFARARPAPIATFYKGNRVLVVETMEDENAYD